MGGQESAPGHTAEWPRQDFTLFLTQNHTPTPTPALGESGNVEGEHRPVPQTEQNSGRRGRGEGMEEEGRAAASRRLDPGRGAFEMLHHCAIIIPISQMRKVKLSQVKGSSKVTEPVGTEPRLEPDLTLNSLNIDAHLLCSGHLEREGRKADGEWAGRLQPSFHGHPKKCPGAFRGPGCC